MWVAAPIAKNILTDAISALNIEKSKEGLDKIYQWYDVKYYKVENVEGLSVKEATKLLKNFQVEYTGIGDKVLAQSPAAGTSLPQNSTIRLLLGN